MINACIVGYGVIGKATAESLGIKKYYSRSDSNMTLDEVGKCRYIFICLPTNVSDQGYETKDIENIIENVWSKDNIIILRSTVNPGYCQSLQERFGLNIVYVPEFLSEDTASEDAKNPQLIVIGSNDNKILKEVEAIYRSRFKYCSFYITNLATAELIKIGINAFFTTKVIFANTIFDYAQKTGANYEVFKSMIEAHPWGSKNHFRIFDKKGRGAGGKCLSKDMSAIRHYSDSLLFTAVSIENSNLLELSNKT